MPKLTTERREIATKFGRLFGHLFINTGGNDPIELMVRVVMDGLTGVLAVHLMRVN